MSLESKQSAIAVDDRLDLRKRKLGPDAVRGIAETLRTRPIITLLLSGNALGDEGAVALADVLSKEARLTELHLGGNGIGPLGWQAITYALRTHPTLRLFDASHSGTGDDLSDDALPGFVSFIRCSPVLRSLTLNAAKLSDASLGLLAEAIGDNRTLVHVNLQRRIPAEHHERIQLSLERNRGDEQRATEIEITLPSAEELAICARVLDTLTKRPNVFFEHIPGMNPVRAGANRLVESVRRHSDARRRTRSEKQSHTDKTKRKAQDSAAVATTGMRRMRDEVLPMLPAPSTEAPPSTRLAKARHCYVCKDAYFDLNAYYDSLCPECAALNLVKRAQTADLSGKTVLITGGRIKIGYEATLKLLRSGANVVMTTRFACDAALRFAREDDFNQWSSRLRIHAVDLRDIRAVERLAETLAEELPRLDILINNAAQTVRRPSEYYRHLLDGEAAGRAALPPAIAAVVAPGEYHASSTPVIAASLSQVALLPEDLDSNPALFPPATVDRHGQQIDRRAVNSWVQELGEIATNEVLETHYVNAIAPFVLINRLLPIMERTPGHKQVVNVSAMEGKFEYARKQSAHPHTNMAKAALNMLTRTVAGSLAERGVFMNSVDTGWVTNENPMPLTDRMRENFQFEPPLDEIDGAARVLDPVFDPDETPRHGLFLKDYKPVGW